MSFILINLWVLLLVGVVKTHTSNENDAFDNFFSAFPRTSVNINGATGDGRSHPSRTPELIKGEDILQKILGLNDPRIVIPTRSPTQDLHTESKTKIDFTTIDTPTIVDYADKRIEDVDNLFLERPTRIPKFRGYTEGEISQVESTNVDKELPFTKNPTFVPTRLLLHGDNELHSIYEDSVRSEYGILTPHPSRTSDTTADDWYRVRTVQQTLQDQVFRGLTVWSGNETMLNNFPEVMRQQIRPRPYSNPRRPRPSTIKTKRSRTTTSTTLPTRRRKTTTTSTTTKFTRRRRTKSSSTLEYTFTPPCYDTMGYRIRCTNSTEVPSTTTSTTPTWTTPTWSTPTWTTTEESNETETESTTSNTTFTTTSGTPTTTEPTLSDIGQLLAILDNLTYIYDINIVEVVNDTLQREGYPYCKTTLSTTSTSSTVATRVADNLTGSVMSKCYVCGLDAEGIPQDSNCADAFASDFFPMSPVDMTSRKYMDSYKKQCRYMDMPKWQVNDTRGRSMWGKWTGGCAVRWLDISSVYTQRSCRNRHRPALGKHFASKRMAKLEYALFREDNACIISPQASLVPFSRGISLYARTHACVCTGNYCNRAERVSTLYTRRMVAFSLVVVLGGS